MATERIYASGISYLVERREGSRGRRSQSNGQESQISLGIWHSKAIHFDGLMKAVDFESPTITHKNGHLPHELPAARDPRLEEPVHKFWEKISVAGLDIIEIWSRQNDKS